MLGLKVDFLTRGCRYDVQRRTAVVPAGSAQQTTADTAAETIEVGSLDR
jgi:hypothetical protein